MVSESADCVGAGKALDADKKQATMPALRPVDGLELSEVDAEWGEEIDRRVGEILAGEIHLVSGDETLTMARALLAARRSQ